MTTNFQKKVYELVKKIPKGKTTTYKIIAEKLNTSPRAVGQALKRNPYDYASYDFRRRQLKKSFTRTGREAQKKPLRCLLIPCHRVIKSDGTLGGYAGKMNSKLKKRLLKKEGVEVKNTQSKPL